MKIKSVFPVISIFLLVLFIIGPKNNPTINPIQPINLPDDLDMYLKNTEQQYADIRKGTEKTIIWADIHKKEKTEYAIVYLHGFSASRQEIAPLCDLLAKQLNANLYYTRLAGHGQSSSAMSEATVNDWIHDMIEAVSIARRLGKKIIVMGTSTGATLAMWFASYDVSDDIAAFILISPNFGLKNKFTELINWPWAEYFIPLVIGKERSFKPINEQQSYFWTTHYPIKALFTMMGIVKRVREIDFEHIQAPFLFLFSTKDTVVDSKTTEHIFDRLGSKHKTKCYIENSQCSHNHIIAGDIVSPATTQPIIDLIMDYLDNMNTGNHKSKIKN
ncbi:MAG: alpha/beta fold hydrolase [Desulfobacterales bacterium]|nr:alpha/beta fold hydrolase [Desulfobacterales bacterium]